MPRPTLAQARAQYMYRYTMEHVPAWAREPMPNGRYPAPHFRTDAEWFDHTKFPGEPGLHGNCRHCQTLDQTWPLGSAPLAAPFAREVDTPGYRDAPRAPEITNGPRKGNHHA